MSEPVKCSSGREYPWTPPPRRVHWRHSRIADHYLKRVMELNAEGGLLRDMLESMAPEERREAEAKANVEKFYAFMEGLTDDELKRLEAYATDLVKAGTGRADISDIPDADMWELFARARGVALPDAATETDEGEVQMSVIESFRPEPDVSPLCADVPDVRGGGVAADGAA